MYGIHYSWQNDMDVQLSLQWFKNDYKSFDMNINKLTFPPTYVPTYLPTHQLTYLFTHQLIRLPI
jgi:glyoxylate utilization-related uncharacterized protein